MTSFTSLILAEWRRIPQRLGGAPGIVMFIAFLGGAGGYMPYMLGFGFLDPQMILMYSCCGPFFLTNFVADSMLDPSGTDSSRILLAAKLLASVLFGWMTALLYLGLGLLVANIKIGHGSPVLPDLVVLAGCLLLGLSVTILAVALYAILSLRKKHVDEAKAINRRALLVALALLIFAVRFSPPAWRDGFSAGLNAEGICTIAAIGCTALLAVSAPLLWAVSRHPRFR